jgi:orotidine-5'-phosphate decarboxylase
MAELVVAFDVVSGREAFALADRLPQLRWAKIGPMLFVREGPTVVHEFAQRGVDVFLDLKWHDIPSIVAEAVTAARDLGVAMATVHCLAGHEVLAAAVRAAGPDLALVGVTLLTSHGPGCRADSGSRRPRSGPRTARRSPGHEAGCGRHRLGQELTLLRRWHRTVDRRSRDRLPQSSGTIRRP